MATTRYVRRNSDGVILTATEFLLKTTSRFTECDLEGNTIVRQKQVLAPQPKPAVKEEGGYPFDALRYKRELVAYGIKEFGVDMLMTLREEEMREKLRQLYDERKANEGD